MSAARPKPAGFVYGALSAAMVVVLAALSVTSAQSPPPAIAELAPQAAQQIKDAPAEQASAAGQGPGGGDGAGAASTTTTRSAAGVAATTTTTAPPERKARLRRCFGTPPRQTEDPQSPPCVPFFEGDNGGATTRGVTADAIRIAVPRGTDARALTAIETYLNTRYELYGRSIRLVATGGFGAACTEQRAEAVSIEAQQVFAATDAGTANSSCLYDELTRRRIVTSEVSYAFTEPQAQARHPYLWEYLMGDDQMFGAVGEMVCARLAGGKATHAGAALRQTDRRFGVILQTANRDDRLPTKPLETALARCGVTVASTVTYDFSEDQGTRGRDAVLQMQQADVTSVICLCEIVVEATLAPSATSQAYFPEWIYTSYGSNDYDILFKASVTDPQQRAASMAVTVQPPQRPLSQEYGWLAYKEADPGLQASYVDAINLITLYRSLLLLVSGIQMAGPRLTPDAFARGLQSTPFPNPVDPGSSGAVGFLGPDHGMTNDAAEMWWSETATGADGSAGGWCYVDRGARRKPGAWPKGSDPFFTGPCTTGAG